MGSVFDLINRPMISEDINYLKENKIAHDIFGLVDRYARENFMICNGRLMANNLSDGKNHITTANIYRLWEYASLVELANLNNLENSMAGNKSPRILDCGGCSSSIDFFLAEKGFQVYSVDLNEFLVFNGNHVAKEKHLPLKNIAADMTHLSFGDNYFDIVFSISVLEHFDEKLRFTAIREMERVVKPGGLIFNTFDYGEYYSGKQATYNIPAEYSRHTVIKDIDEVIELATSASNSELVGNSLTDDLKLLPKKAPQFGEFLIYLDLKRSFDAHTNFGDLRYWLIRFILFKFARRRLINIYQKGLFYNFFRLMLQKRFSPLDVRPGKPPDNESTMVKTTAR